MDIPEEIDLLMAYSPRAALDAGCGTGRVAIELARRGVDVVGVDIDPARIETARAAAPDLDWRAGDIRSISLGRRFDLIVLAGNVAVFLERGTEGAALRNLAAHLSPGGHLVAGFALAMGYLELDEYDRLAREAGLAAIERYSSWQRAPFDGTSKYVVAVHARRDDAAHGTART
jgi:SAM-dependent methyltransferase